jgi:hypothetical protein
MYMCPRSIQQKDGLRFSELPTKGEGEDGRMVMNRTMSTRLFHAFFCLIRCTFRGKVACRAAKSFDRKVASLPTINPWQQWVDVRLIAHEGHMGGPGPLLRLRCPLVWLLRKKLPTSLEKRHRGLLQIGAKWLLATKPSSSLAVLSLPHCMGLLFGFWGPESETIFGLGI